MRLKEAIKYANDHGNKVNRMDIAAVLRPHSSDNARRFNINSLVCKRTKKVAPDWVRSICEICGVDANFLFSETDKQKAKRKSRAGCDVNGSNFNANAKDGQGVSSDGESEARPVNSRIVLLSGKVYPIDDVERFLYSGNKLEAIKFQSRNHTLLVTKKEIKEVYLNIPNDIEIKKGFCDYLLCGYSNCDTFKPRILSDRPGLLDERILQAFEIFMR